ncbi:glycosyltransferase family 2 protein [Synechococcus sp. HK05]|uniref:glycosyltransferase n=1 Tax=Synechococcus sp. HK05 TaxID=2725975 RepID=UPI001C394277|nr:glycosyltransferase family 2 protein [Synechococcus sp. HK05]MBV2352044.1 glycosyltransferase family 2 protein [Synechococcus sp. HK05]
MVAPDPLPLVGIVVPVYNDWSRLQLCLQAMARQTYPSERLRVRVVDNGSTDWPSQPSFPLPLEVIVHRHPGSYGARNQAALDWDVDVLAFTDADCQPDPDWIAAGVVALQWRAQPPKLVAGRIVLEPQAPGYPSPGEQLDQILGFDQARTVRRAGFGVTANLLVSQACFQNLEGFHRRTHSGGDREFCHRAVAAGAQLLFAGAAVVRHPARDWSELVRKQRRIVGGRLSLAGDHPFARLKVLAQSLRPLISESVRVGRYQPLGWRRRGLLLSLVWRLRLAVLLEWIRLQHQSRTPLR